MRIRNVHRRFVATEAEAVGRLLDTLGTANDQLWPRDRWPPMRFSGDLVPGAEGGHGPVRYRIAERDPRRTMAFTFLPRGLAKGLRGGHRFELTPSSGGTMLSHVLEAECGAATWLLWAGIIRPLHDALIEDAFDRAEGTLTGRVAAPARWSRWVRVLRRALRRRA